MVEIIWYFREGMKERKILNLVISKLLLEKKKEQLSEGKPCYFAIKELTN